MIRNPAARWRLLYVAVVAVLGVIYYNTRVTWAMSQIRAALVENSVRSLQVTSGDVQTWIRTRQAQASLLARVVEQERAATHPDAELSARYSAVLSSLVTRGDYVAGWLRDANGRVLAAAGDTAQPPVSRATASMVRARDHRTIVDFIAGAGRADRPPIATVVLRSAPTDSSFPFLNPARTDRIGRTMITHRVGDSTVIVLTRGLGSTVSPGTRATASLPAYVQRARDDVPTQGAGPGFAEGEIAYASLPLPALGWVLLREQSVDQLAGGVRTALKLETFLVASLVLFAVLLIDYRVRSARLSRNHEMTQLRTDFVSSVSHELRTPLTQIRMYAELLRKGTLHTAADRARAIEVIEKESRRLNILVDNVLNFTRLRRQHTVQPTVPSDVRDDIAHVVEAFAPLAAERGVIVRSTVDGHPRALVDSLALRQIILNFLENAVKYGPAGQTVTVGAREVNGQVRIWVSDEGPGVPTSERSAVWAPFSRGAAAAVTASTGSGIGLSVVHDLVTQHGGTVAVETSPAGGASFVVLFRRPPSLA